MARLGDICTIYTGTGFPNQYQGETSGDYPFYKVGDISKNVTKGNKYLQECDNYVSADIVKKIKGTIVPIDTVVFAKIGEAVKLNKRAITSKNCLVDNNAMGVCPDQKRLNLSYFFHYMCNIQLETYAEATTVPSVKKSIIENLDIPLPTYEEQTKKSLILDKVCDLISLRKQQLSKLDELVKSRFIELFASVEDEDRLINLCTFIDYRGKTPEKTESGLPFITAKNVKMHHMSLDTQEFISKETYNKVMTRGFPQIGDVVFTTEAPLGNVCRIPYIETEFYIGQRIITMQTEQLEPAYLEYALSSDEFKRKIAEKSSGSTVTGIRSKLLEQLTIPVPPRVLQRQFAAFVEQVDKSKFEIQKSLEKLETLKKALMQKYFG